MMIIEALKELPLIIKKIEKNNGLIQEYAAISTNRENPFGSIEACKEKVKSLLQSNQDLIDNYLELKRDISYTNAISELKIGDKTISITAWLMYRNILSSLELEGYSNLNTKYAESSFSVSKEEAVLGVQINRMYYEGEKLKAIETIEDRVGKIDSALEIFNATNSLTKVFS